MGKFMSLTINCSVCGKDCLVWRYRLKNYSYKIKRLGKVYVQCSYSCHIKQERIFNEYDNKYREN